MQNPLEVLIYFFIVLVVSLGAMYLGKKFSDSISEYEVINPKPGVECIVVSRSFNTSVDCWTE